MKTYQKCCDEVGLTRDYRQDVPDLEYDYFKYEKGTATKISAAEFEMSPHNAQKERVATAESKATHDAFWAARRKLEDAAYGMWYAGLEEEHSNMGAKLFLVIYSQAYEDAHSGGYDEVAAKFNDLADFADRVLGAV